MRTAQKMGIKTVAVYSTADRDAPHVKFADEAACLGEPQSNKSYLVISKIIEVACWSHTRSKFFDAARSYPRQSHQVLEWIKQLYDIEDEIVEKQLSDIKKVAYRVEHSRPIVDRYFKWLRKTHEEHILLPSNPFIAFCIINLDLRATN